MPREAVGIYRIAHDPSFRIGWKPGPRVPQAVAGYGSPGWLMHRVGGGRTLHAHLQRGAEVEPAGLVEGVVEEVAHVHGRCRHAVHLARPCARTTMHWVPPLAVCAMLLERPLNKTMCSKGTGAPLPACRAGRSSERAGREQQSADCEGSASFSQLQSSIRSHPWTAAGATAAALPAAAAAGRRRWAPPPASGRSTCRCPRPAGHLRT